MNKLIIAVDFDGTICIDNKFPEIGTPRLWLIEYIKKLRAEGNQIILWTCRQDDGAFFSDRLFLTEAVDFCKSFDLEFDAVNKNIGELADGSGCRKVFAHWYIDDKSMLFDDEQKQFIASLKMKPDTYIPVIAMKVEESNG